MLYTFHPRAFMNALELTIEWLPVALQAWIFVLFLRKALYRRFPVFFVYTVCQIATGLLRGISLGSQNFFYIYWWSAAIIAVLSFLSLHESFRSIFHTFYRLPWFRLLWPGTIVLIWVYAAWRAAVHPQVHFTRAGAMLVSVAIVVSYTIVGLALLFFLMVKIVQVRWHLYEFHIVYGLGLTALGMMIAALLRSEFGTKFAWVTEWGPPLAYLIGVLVWLSAFLRNEPRVRVDQPPEELLEQMRNNLDFIRKRFRRPLH